MQTPEQFYDDLAADYDSMTQFSARLEKQKNLFTGILEKFPAVSVLDMGCGTGVHAVALAQLGLEVIGVDLSAGMLARAKKHAAQSDTDIRFLHGDFLMELPAHSTDMILCLGNSIPHLASREALATVLAHWRKLLTPGGHVIIQLLNYRRILAQRERIVNIRRDGEQTIIRFYDFLNDALRFNILTIEEGAAQLSHTLRETQLLPFTDGDMRESAQKAGFTDIHIYGSLHFTPYTADGSDCVAVLT